jgi:hypothetical protein
MRSIRRSLQAQFKIIKKLSKHLINKSKRKISQKKVFKKQKSPKYVMGPPQEICRLDPISLKKIIGTSNLPIQTKLKKKVYLVPQK